MLGKIADIIQYEGDNATFIWKHPIEDFNTGTQLIVHESQEAVFFMNGQALDLFGPGRHTLETQNIPLICGLLNKPTGDRSPFHCEVYFINKTEQMAIKWGTDSRVQYMEPTYNFPLSVGASGEMSLLAADARRLLVKLTGTEKTLTQESLTGRFRSFLLSKVKPYLARVMRESGFSVFEADEHMGEISEALHERLTPDFAEYGLRLERFFVTTIVKPEGDKAYEKFREIHVRQYSDVAEAQLRQKVGIIDQQTQVQKMVMESAGLAQKRVQEGYTYHQERGFDVAEQMARNEAVGQISNMGVGLGMMAGVSGSVGTMVADMTQGAFAPVTRGAGSMGTDQRTPVSETPSSSPVPAGDGEGDMMSAFRQRLEKLSVMKQMGMLNDEEFAAEKQKILDSI